MYLVAISRWGAPLSAELATLAQVLSVAASDLRLRLSGPLPVIVAAPTELQEAQRLLGLLRKRGHGAVACDGRHVPTAETTLVPRSFELAAQALVAFDSAGEPHPLPYSDVLGLICAAEMQEDLRIEKTQGRKLALGRALMTGGVMRYKKTEEQRQYGTVEREEVCFVFRRSGHHALVLRELGLRYDGLGDSRALTRRQSFTTLIAQLRRRAPQAIYDDRLRHGRRARDLSAVAGTSTARTVSLSNASANATAAHLLIHAHLQRQV